MKTPASDPEYESLHNIEQYVRNSVDLTRQLLGFARGGKYEPRPLDLNTIIRNQNRVFGRTRKEIQIHTDLADNAWTVEIDRAMVHATTPSRSCHCAMDSSGYWSNC